MTSKKEQTTAVDKKRFMKRGVIFTISLTTLYVISLFIPGLSGTAAYPQAVIKCGGKEPYIAIDFFMRTYETPGDGLYKGPNIFTSPEDYFCSKAEVEKAMYQPRLCESSRYTVCTKSVVYDGLVLYIIVLLTMTLVMTSLIVIFPWRGLVRVVSRILNYKIR